MFGLQRFILYVLSYLQARDDPCGPVHQPDSQAWQHQAQACSSTHADRTESLAWNSRCVTWLYLPGIAGVWPSYICQELTRTL